MSMRMRAFTDEAPYRDHARDVLMAPWPIARKPLVEAVATPLARECQGERGGLGRTATITGGRIRT